MGWITRRIEKAIGVVWAVWKRGILEYFTLVPAKVKTRTNEWYGWR